jgi:prefoldin subunit 5
MKLAILVTLLLTVACGKRDPLPYSIAKGIGAEETGDIKKLDKKVKSLAEKIEDLENNFTSLNADISAVSDSVTELRIDMEDGDETLQGQINTLNGIVDSLQDDMDDVQEELSEVSTGQNIVRHIDPCGDQSGHYDEILMVTQDGTVIAYFEVGNKRFLSELTPGVLYQTTDNQACRFKVTEDGELTSNVSL